MRKLRDDSIWNQLTPGRRQTLANWWFDENPGCPRTVERVKADFGLSHPGRRGPVLSAPRTPTAGRGMECKNIRLCLLIFEQV
jgi:hypothetical protein